MKLREALAWWLLIATYMFMFYGMILGFRLYPFFGTQMPCKAIEIILPMPSR